MSSAGPIWLTPFFPSQADLERELEHKEALLAQCMKKDAEEVGLGEAAVGSLRGGGLKPKEVWSFPAGLAQHLLLPARPAVPRVALHSASISLWDQTV